MKGSVLEIVQQLKLGSRVLKLVFEASPRWASFYLLNNAVSSVIPAVSLYVGKLAVDAVVAAANLAMKNSAK